MSIAVVSSVISQPNTANCGVAVLSAHNLVGLFTSNTAQLLPSPSRGAVHTYNPPLPIAMAHTNRTFTSNLHRPSMAHSQAQSGPSPALLARVQEKRVELENLKELRDLSAGLASQMRALEEKLATLADGTEAVALVLSNWHNVLRAIHLASMKVPKPRLREGQDEPETNDFPLPQTLVRIPVAESALSEAHQR